MNVHELVKAAIKAQEGDGLWQPGGPCGCGLDDFAPCGDGPFPTCVLARRLVIPEDCRLIDPKTGEVVYCDEGFPGDSMFVPY